MILLALKNIKVRKLRTFLISFSITIGTMSLIIFLGLNEGIKKASFEELEKSKSLNEITVRPKVEESQALAVFKTLTERRLQEKDLETIKNIEGVAFAYPETQFNEFTSLETNLMGYSLITDAMVFGIEEGYIKNDIKIANSWNETNQPYPAIVSRKLLDIYNFTIAIPQGLPTISEKTLIGKEITMYPGFSTFFPDLKNKSDEIKLKVVGFSDKVSMVGITLPLNIVETLNQKYAPKSKTQFHQIHVITNNPENTSEIAKTISSKNYSTHYLLEEVQNISAKVNYLTYALLAISILILSTSSLAIISTFLGQIAERIKELGLYRALGARKNQIKKLILIEASLIGLFGSILGILLGKTISIFINNYIEKKLEIFEIIPENFLIITPKIITIVLFFGTLIAIFSAYYPASKASNISPIKAISK